MNFRDIPPKDINYIISHYKLPSQGNKYLTVWNFLITNKDVLVPTEIADYIIAFNNIDRLKKYKLSELLTNKIIIGNVTDTNRIARILKYANKLEDDSIHFSMLPDDILFEILSKLDYDTIIGFCNISKQFEIFNPPLQ